MLCVLGTRVDGIGAVWKSRINWRRRWTRRNWRRVGTIETWDITFG